MVHDYVAAVRRISAVSVHAKDVGYFWESLQFQLSQSRHMSIGKLSSKAGSSEVVSLG